MTRLPTLEVFRRFTGSVQIAHHIAGRIRFKLGAIELDQAGREALADAKQFQHALDSIPGVKSIRLNLLARSCTVEYDPAVIPQQAWPDVLGGIDSPASAKLLGILRDKLEGMRDA
ncbi:MAG: cation transporter [Candidatus Dactylopiibacterium sp.]|nr:cation transporter [Candidatus Dactylopiibacterium sp.]